MTYWEEFSEVEGFVSSTPEEQEEFGKFYAKKLAASKPEYQADPEFAGFVETKILEEIRANQASPEVGTGAENETNEPGIIEKVLGPRITEELKAADPRKAYQKFKSQTMSENLGQLGQSTLDVLKHTAGIPARALTGLAQVPHFMAARAMEAAGMEDTSAYKWVQASYDSLAKQKESMKVYRGIMSEMEPDVLFAGAAGGGIGFGMRTLSLKSLNTAAAVAKTPGYSALDAAITNAATTVAGEIAVVQPAIQISEHHITNSGYTETTKNTLRTVLPIMFGLASGMTYERYLDRALRNPLVVDDIMKSVAKGATPEETAGSAHKLIQPPKPIEILAKKTNDRLPVESGKNFGSGKEIQSGFQPKVKKAIVEKPATTNDIYIATKGATPEGLTEVGRTTAINDAFVNPKFAKEKAEQFIKKHDLSATHKPRTWKKHLAIIEEADATISRRLAKLNALNDPDVDEMARQALTGRTVIDPAAVRKSLEPVTKQEMLPGDTRQAIEAQNRIADIVEQAALEETPQAGMQTFIKNLQQAVSDGKLLAKDVQQATTLGKDTFQSWLFKPNRDEILATLDKIGVTGRNTDELGRIVTAHLGNQAGYIDSAFLRGTMFHGVPLMTGWDEEDGEIFWNPEKYLKWGASFNAVLGGGAIYRRMKGGKRVRIVGSQVAKKLWKAVDAPIWRGLGQPLHKFRLTEGMAPEVAEIPRVFKKATAAKMREWGEFTDRLTKEFSADERNMMSDFIEREGDWQNIPKVLQEQAALVQNAMREIRVQLEDAGFDPALFAKHGDQWMHRVYVPRISQRLRNLKRSATFKSIQANWAKRRGKSVSLDRELKKIGLEADRFQEGDKVYQGLDANGRKLWAHERQADRIRELRATGPVKEWEVIRSPKGKQVTVNRDYTKAERQAMGESRDLALRLGMFFREASQDISLGKMYSDLSEDSRFVFKKPDDVSAKIFNKEMREAGKVKLPDSYTTSGIARYGKLNGQWVDPDIAKQLKRMTSKRFEKQWAETATKIYQRGFMLPWKIAKTAYNPATHTLNTTTNILICGLDGRNPVDVIARGITALASKNETFQLAIKAGLKDSGIQSGEWNIKGFVDATSGLSSGGADTPKILQVLYSTMSKAGKGVKGLAKAPMTLYEWEDEVFKLGVISQELAKGRTAEEALDIANGRFFDYSDVPSGVEFVRDWGFMPFISYTYKIIPFLANVAADHPERLIAATLAINAANNAMYELQYKDKAEGQKALEKDLRPEWQKEKLFGIGPDAQVRLANDPKTGQARSISAGRFIPGATVFSDNAQSFPFGMNPIVSLAVGGFLNKNAAFDQTVMKHQQPRNDFQKAQNFDGMAKFITNTLLPNIPGIPYTYSTERIGNALVATGDINENSGPLWTYAQKRGWTGKDYGGHDLDFSDEVLSSLGLKISRMDVEQEATKKLVHLSKYGSRAKRDYTTALRKDIKTHKSTRERMDALTDSYVKQVTEGDTELKRFLDLLGGAD